jgi:bifunctional NMN adenylyltransferase/nudix hydrolase
MKKPFDSIVFIGRFQPLHKAHLGTIEYAFTLAEKVIIFIGSSFQPRTYKNPFTAFERYNFIKNSLVNHKENLDYFVIDKQDFYSDDEWIDSIVEDVYQIDNDESKIAIIGYNKDSSSYYLNEISRKTGWDVVETPFYDNLSATTIRELYFTKSPSFSLLENVVSSSTLEFLKSFKNSDEFENIVLERECEENTKRIYSSLPFPPVFVTVDAVVFSGNYVLMITRKNAPGKDLLALPGGFLDANTDPTLEDAVIRELMEETNLAIHKNDIQDSKVFDSISRSSRGRSITHAFMFDLHKGRPAVIGSSDASNAQWYEVSKLDSSKIFEDHFQIINYFYKP